jgi:uncharacterized protein
VRAVLDPNVVISGFLSQAGSPARVLRAWREGRFEAIVSPLVLAELARALTYPKLRQRIPTSDADAAVRWLRVGATVLDDPTEHPPVHSEDPDDDYLIALAASERAAVVSGDRHLLALSARIPVHSPRDFLDVLR